MIGKIQPQWYMDIVLGRRPPLEEQARTALRNIPMPKVPASIIPDQAEGDLFAAYEPTAATRLFPAETVRKRLVAYPAKQAESSSEDRWEDNYAGDPISDDHSGDSASMFDNLEGMFIDDDSTNCVDMSSDSDNWDDRGLFNVDDLLTNVIYEDLLCNVWHDD